MFVYTIQLVVKQVWQPVWQAVGCLFTQYSRLSIRLYNRFDNRLYRVNGVLRSAGVIREKSRLWANTYYAVMYMHVSEQVWTKRNDNKLTLIMIAWVHRSSNTLTERRYDAASVERHNLTKIVDKLAVTARSVSFFTRIQRPERTYLDNTTAATISYSLKCVHHSLPYLWKVVWHAIHLRA